MGFVGLGHFLLVLVGCDVVYIHRAVPVVFNTPRDLDLNVSHIEGIRQQRQRSLVGAKGGRELGDCSRRVLGVGRVCVLRHDRHGEVRPEGCSEVR